MLSLLCISIPVAIRTHLGLPLMGGANYTSFSSGYVPNINAKDYIITLMKQTIAALPLSYQAVKYIIKPTEIFNDLRNIFYPSAIIIIIAYFSLYLAISKRVIEELFEPQHDLINVKPLSIIGLALLILPGTLISLSPRYQKEIYWGVGYLPVYISYFGAAMIVVAAIYSIYKKVYNYNKKYIVIISLIFAAAISIIGALTYNSNVSVVEQEDSNWLYPRLIIEDGLHGGLFKSVPNESILLVDSSNPWWEQPGFYLMHSGVRLSYVGSNGAYSNDYISDKLPKTALVWSHLNKSSYHFSESNNVFYLRYNSLARNEGYSILGRIEDLLASKKTLDNVTGASALIYVRYADNSKRDFYVYGKWAQYNSPQLFDSFWLSEKEMKPISTGKNWKLFFIDGANKIIDLRSLEVLIPSEKPKLSDTQKGLNIFRLNNWYDPESWSGIPTQWMRDNATIMVISPENRTANLRLQALSLYRNRMLEVSSGNALIAKVSVSTSFINVSAPVSLAKGANIMRFNVPDGCERPCDRPELNNPDSRCLSVAVQNLTVV